MVLQKFLDTTRGIDDAYRNDQQFVVTESLVRAIEVRLKKTTEPEAGVELDTAIRGGGLLARQFYRELGAFEAGPEGIRVFYPVLMKNVEIEPAITAYAEVHKKSAHA